MRVLIEATAAIHGERAVRKYSRYLIKHLLESDNDITYIIYYHDWKNSKSLRLPLPSGGKHREYVLRIPGRLTEWSWKRYSLPKIESLVGEIDIVYGTDLIFPPARRAFTVSTLHGIAYIAVPDLISESHTVSLRKALGYALRESDYFLAVSENTKEEVTKLLQIPEDRIKVYTFGVDPNMRQLNNQSLVAKIVRERFGVEQPYLLFVGVISHRKNILNLIDAFSRIGAKIPSLSLVLAGPIDNAYEPAVALIRKRDLGSRIKFLGPVSPDSDDLLYLYNGAQLLLYPTLHEGWTSPPLEAMACGIPVVTSDYRSVSESAGRAALLVDPLNVESIAEGGLRVLLDELLRGSLVDLGFRRAEECQWSRCAKRFESILLDLVHSGFRKIRTHT